MISPALAVALLVAPCVSQVDHQPRESVAYQCPAPEVQGPPRPPLWWFHRQKFAAESEQALAVPPPPKVVKKSQARIKKATRLCGSKRPVWYVKAGKKRYRCR